MLSDDEKHLNQFEGKLVHFSLPDLPEGRLLVKRRGAWMHLGVLIFSFLMVS